MADGKSFTFIASRASFNALLISFEDILLQALHLIREQQTHVGDCVDGFAVNCGNVITFPSKHNQCYGM